MKKNRGQKSRWILTLSKTVGYAALRSLLRWWASNSVFYNGKTHIEVLVSEDMVGTPSRRVLSDEEVSPATAVKMQKELEQKQKVAEIAAAQAAKTATDVKK